MGGGRPYDMRADVMSRQSRHTRFVEAAWPIQRNSKSEEAHITICERTDKMEGKRANLGRS